MLAKKELFCRPVIGQMGYFLKKQWKVTHNVQKMKDYPEN